MPDLIRENAAIKATIELFNKIYKVNLVYLSKPDDNSNNNIPMNMRIDSLYKNSTNNSLFAIEHTTIHFLENQPGLEIQYNKLFQEIKKIVLPKLKSNGNYLLGVSAESDLTGFNYINQANKIAEWCLTSIPNLAEPPNHFLKNTFRNIPVEFTLYKFESTITNVFTAGFLLPNNKDKFYQESINKALLSKTPKLSLYSQKGYKTLLILDYADIQNSDVFAYSKEIFLQKNNFEYTPDYIIITDANLHYTNNMIIESNGNIATLWNGNEEPIIIKF
jgi:hypothetical protein